MHYIILGVNMLISGPEFDLSSKEINILERRDASIAMIATLLSVVVTLRIFRHRPIG